MVDVVRLSHCSALGCKCSILSSIMSNVNFVNCVKKVRDVQGVLFVVEVNGVKIDGILLFLQYYSVWKLFKEIDACLDRVWWFRCVLSLHVLDSW